MRDYINMIPSKDVREYIIENNIVLSTKQIIEIIRAYTNNIDLRCELLSELSEFAKEKDILDLIDQYIKEYNDYKNIFYNSEESDDAIFNVNDYYNEFGIFCTFSDAFSYLKQQFIEGNVNKFGYIQKYIISENKYESMFFNMDSHTKDLYVLTDTYPDIEDELFNEEFILGPFEIGDRVKPSLELIKGFETFGINLYDYDSDYDYWFISSRYYPVGKILNGYYDTTLVYFDVRTGRVNEHIHNVKTWMLEYEEDQLDDIFFIPEDSDNKIELGKYIAADLKRLIKGEFVYLSNFTEAYRYFTLTNKNDIELYRY